MQINKWKQDDSRFDLYIQNLKKHGLRVHPSLKPAIFTLNNGLQYPGLRLQSPIIGSTNLVTVPTTLLLTSHKARQQPKLSQLFQHPFYNTGQLWQDRILITYLLFIYQKKDTQNIWYQMVSLFSKEIDILSFWQESQIRKFQDKSVNKAAMLERQNFQKQWIEFQNVKQDNQYFFSQFQKQAFGKVNYQWIYTHAVSRCFGSFMNSTYFTPFCQFFNHHCVDVSYQCVTEQQNLNNIQRKQSINEQNKIQTQNEDDLSETQSISSGNSVDYIEQGDFNYWQIQSYKIKWGGKISFDLKEKQTLQVQKLYNECMQLVQKSLVWSGFNFVFIGQIIEKINIVNNQYKAGRKKFLMTQQDLNKTKLLIENYKSQALTFYRLMGSKYDFRAQTQQAIDNLSSSNHANNHLSAQNYKKTSSPPTKNYKYFLMETGPNAQFHQNQQIFFCYGKISNRAMLIRYGCCIQENRYEHVWLKVSLNKILSPYPDLFENIQQKGFSINYKLKLKPTVWSFQLYLWLKVEKWQLIRHEISQIFYPYDIDKEIDIFESIIMIIRQKIEQYKSYPYYQDLIDKSISYHEYFTRVYHRQKVKILQKQIEMCQYVLSLLRQMKKQKRIIKTRQFKNILFRKQLKGYWKILQKGQITF